jgi:predicted RNA-binding protein
MIMCEANVYLVEGENKELIMEAVDMIEPLGDTIKLTSIFGDQKTVAAEIQSLSLVDHKVFLKKR